MSGGRSGAVAAVAVLFVFSACGIAFELLLAAYAGYLLGESLLLFSAVVGLFLSCMGVGAHLSRRVKDPPADAFLAIGALLGAVGGVAPVLVVLWNAVLPNVEIAVGLGTALCGGALGAAIPLAARLVQGSGALPRVIAWVLAVDYLGALGGSLLLPLLVLPGAGFTRGAALLGLATLAASAAGAVLLWTRLRRPAGLLAGLLAGAVALAAALLHGPRAQEWALVQLRGERILHREHSPYQEILLSEDARGLILRLNGRLQFSDAWEREYHEALVHPAFALSRVPPRDVLVLGGGDGLALREIFKYPEVRRVVLVDLDPQMVSLARRDPRLRERNRRSFDDPRVTPIYEDAFLYVRRASEDFDVVIVDLPQPVSVSLSKLYSVEFYRNVARRSRPGGFIAVQSEEVETSRGWALWCIARTLEAAGLYARPYLMGSLGFTLAARVPFDLAEMRPRQTGILTAAMMRGLFELPRDLGPWPVEVNRLEDHALLRYYR